MNYIALNTNKFTNPFNFGLKLWSTNQNYINEAIKLYNKGYFSYLELFVVPSSYNNYISLWKDINIPFIIHAPHYMTGMNLACNANKSKNMILADEAKKYADTLKADTIIFHSGINGDTNETAKQLKEIAESRAVIENKPYFGIGEGLICNGYSPEEIKMVMDYTGAGFCIDIGHAICAANGIKVNVDEYLNNFLSLNPSMFHISDGDYAGVYDSHLHFGDGSFNINYLLNLIPEKSLISIETNKDSKENLNDFAKDIDYINEKCFRIKLAKETDVKDVFNLSNDPLVRANSFNSDIISFDNHVKWFENKIKNSNTAYYIIRSYNNDFMSQVRFDKDNNSNDWTIGISIADKYRGKGLASKILKDTVSVFIKNNNPINIYAFIKKSNESSVKSFNKAGFIIISEEVINNNDSYKLRFDF